jgi:septal ring-binding cell division protein DamX
MATEAPPPPPDAGASDEDDATNASDNDTESGPAPAPEHRVAPVVASARPQSRHRPYTIQIQAAMDLSGANQMVHRLHALGFQPRMVPTELNGQTWYKVEIGPYATQEEAAAAQQQMHSKYNTAFGGGGAP